MSLETLKVAAVQLSSTTDFVGNLERAHRAIEKAAQTGAQLVATPECTPFLGPEAQILAHAQSLDGPVAQGFAELAAKHEIYLLIGSLPESCDEMHSYNTIVLYGPSGDRLAFYRKIHLFNVETPNGEVLREGDHIAPGEETVVIQIGPWTVGFSICYDVRFPELYRSLSAKGANLLFVPAAFTAETGRDHWETLLKARAVENLSYVVAPNQFGTHFGRRRSYGRSVIYDPWGTALAQCPDDREVITATLELKSLEARRKMFPCLEHRRL